MNILRLNYLSAVAKTGSFSEAAELLYTSQSSVSKQIMALEKELNVQLIDRTNRKIRLTPQGELTLKHAQTLLEAYNALLTDLKGYEHYQGETLSIASIPVMAQYNITGIIAAFGRKYPGIQLDIQEYEACDIPTALENRRCDLAFLRLEMLDDSYDTITICHDRIAAILPANHPLAAAKSISLQQLADEPFLLLEKGTLLYAACLSACEKAGFKPMISYTGKRMENIIELVSKDMGVSLMMAQAASYVYHPHVSIIPLAEDILSHIGLVRLQKKRMTKAAAAFWNFVRAL